MTSRHLPTLSIFCLLPMLRRVHLYPRTQSPNSHDYHLQIIVTLHQLQYSPTITDSNDCLRISLLISAKSHLVFSCKHLHMPPTTLTMKFLIAIFSVFSLLGPFAGAADIEAQEKCKTLHHTDVDLQNTAYLNQKCLLNCNIHGRIWTHMMNEDLSCPGAVSGICKSGSCVQEKPDPFPTPAPNPNAHVGFIDIEMESASLATPANAYATVCIQNFTVDMTLPLVDRSQCTTCLTSTIQGSTFPVWKSICSGSGKLIFVEQSRVTFEVFDNFATGSQVFLGGASLTIPQLLSHGDNHKRLYLALTGGHIAGQINTRVTWTPKA